MTTSLLTLPLRRKRDLVVARQRASQIAGLLGFERRELAGMAAAVFEMAGQAWRRGRDGQLCFQMNGRALQVFANPPTTLHLEVPLPAKVMGLDADDMAFAVQQLGEMTPLDVLAEMQQQNLELLRTLHDLKMAQAELAQLKHPTAVAA